MDIGMQLPTQESTVLRMAGMKDRAGISLRYQISRLDQITMEHWRDNYKLQTGGVLGTGRHSSLTYTHTYRVEAPSLEFGAFWSQHAYNRRDPESFRAATWLSPSTCPQRGPCRRHLLPARELQFLRSADLDQYPL